ncbi:MAG: YHS domain-containing protein [Sedimentisphaerales bacterium]
MNYKKIFLLTATIICLLVIVGCQKKTKPAAPPPATEANATAAAEIEQKICPVMELPIDKNVFTVYQGKKVYFCCTDCKAAFEKNPEKYLSKLPQFKK